MFAAPIIILVREGSCWAGGFALTADGRPIILVADYLVRVLPMDVFI